MKKNNMTVAQFLTLKIDNSDKSQTEIASLLGYPNPNIITMFKQGKTKVPLTKVAELAAALDLDPLHLMRVVMTEYSPETWKVLERVLGNNIVSDTELQVVKIMRDVAGEVNVAPAPGKQTEDFKAMVKDWASHATAKVIRH